uniref:Uncharacterized protein n=1 Tax=Romanomermis culicivorax TaxID=13658 RepID=A0A915KXG0_ROMCU
MLCELNIIPWDGKASFGVQQQQHSSCPVVTTGPKGFETRPRRQVALVLVAGQPPKTLTESFRCARFSIITGCQGYW